MEKIIIWGSGQGFEKRKEGIKEKYQIVAFVDNNCKNDSIVKDGIKYICPDQIINMQYDFVLICSMKYEASIRYQLIYKYGIEKSKIKCIDNILNCKEEKNIEVETIIYESCNQYKKMNKRPSFNIIDGEMWLLCDDFKQEAGNPLLHYFAQDIWGAQRVLQNMPAEHYDIGSRLDGFISHLLVFLEKVNYIDIRPLPYKIKGLEFLQADATNLENIPDNSINSLSSFHAVEHFGLGRYGDPIDPEACFKAMKAFVRVLAPGGILYFGVPIGPKDKVIFNAHRIFNPMTIIDGFEGLKLLEFSVIKGNSPNYENVDMKYVEDTIRNLPDYSCGLFMFTKEPKN